MTTKQTKEFGLATAELEEVRVKMESAQSDIEAELKKVAAALKVVETANADLIKAQNGVYAAESVLADLKPYEELALKKTRKLLEAAVPGVTTEQVTHNYTVMNAYCNGNRERFYPGQRY